MTEQRPPSIKYRYGEPPIHSAGDLLYYDKKITRQQRVFAAPAGSNPYGQEALVTGSDGMQIDIEREARLLPQDGHNRLYTLYAPEVGAALSTVLACSTPVFQIRMASQSSREQRAMQ